MVEVEGRCRDDGVAELAGDDGDVDTFGAKLGGMGVAEAVSGAFHRQSRPKATAADAPED